METIKFDDYLKEHFRAPLLMLGDTDWGLKSAKLEGKTLDEMADEASK
jgi:hypothetical protein